MTSPTTTSPSRSCRTSQRVPWPAFVANDSFEVVAANRGACTLWGVDFQIERLRRDGVSRNLLAVASEFDFPKRIENWDEILELLASMYKGRPAGPDDIEAPSPYLSEVVG